MKTGNSLALVFDRELLDQTGISAETVLDVSTDGDVIVVSPRRPKERATVLKRAMAKADQRYEGVFRRLAE